MKHLARLAAVSHPPSPHRLLPAPIPLPPHNPHFALTTLGEVRLSRSEASADTPTTLGAGKPVALVAYLACTSGRSATREHLVDLLWSDLDRDAGRHSLRHALWQLKRATGDALITGRETLTLHTQVVSDRDAFLASTERRDLDTAVRLYAGDFFPNFAAPGCAHFEQWAELERQRLRSTFLRCADGLVRDWLKSARVRDAATLARRVRDTDPLQQAGWRLLLETLAAGQDQLALGIEADALERLLAHEDLPLEPATRSVLRIARGSGVGHNDGPDADRERALVADLIGREREFSAIVGAWDDVLAGRFVHLHVTAPAGFGKTRLLGDAYARLRAMRARVVRVRGNFGAREMPYSLASDLAGALGSLRGAGGVSDDVASALVALNPALSSHFSQPPDRVEGSEALRRRTIAVRELILAVADEAPVAILIDDVQWADPASCALLAGLLGGIGDEHRVLLVSAARPYAAAKLAARSTTELTLSPLSPGDTGALLASLAAMPDEPWALALPDAMHQATGGSPLLTLETLQLALDQGMLRRGRDVWSTGDTNALLGLLQAGGAIHRRMENALAEHPLLLALLAVAGTRLPTDVLANAMDVAPVGVRDQLAALEQRGLVAHADGFWQLAHDEYLATILDRATPAALRGAHAALGRAIFWSAGDDARQVRQAAGHLALGGEDRLLQSLFARFVRVSRGAGDGRPNRALASELLGEGADNATAAHLVATLPLHVRMGLGSARRVAAAALAASLLPAGIVAAIAATRQPPPPPPDAILVVSHRGSAGETLLHEFPLRLAEWRPGAPLELHVSAQPRWRLLTGHDFSHSGVAHKYADTEWWVGSQAVTDSGVSDLFAYGPDGQTRRLTFMRGDDVNPAWAPDGSLLAYQAGGFHPLRHADIAILDPATGAVRQLTSGDETDSSPVWSPDGTRIAFHRAHWDGKPPELCVVTVDGRRLRCIDGDGLRLHGSPVAWSDDRKVLANILVDGKPELVHFEIETGQHEVIGSRLTGGRIVSPDGRWVGCVCERDGYPAGIWFVHPTDRPDQMRPLLVEGLPNGEWSLLWANAPHTPRHLHHLEIGGSGDPIPGLPHVLTASGYDPSGRPVRLAVLAWRSLDTAIATIDSTGLLMPHRPGQVTIELTAGGWRTATRTFTIRDASAHRVFSEDWRNGLERGDWILFGDPRPSVVRAHDGSPAFWSGDASAYTRGVYSTRTYPLTDGLGLDVRLSTPVTLQQWQNQIVSLVFGIDSLALAAWDHRTGYLPLTHGRPVGVCAVQYPGGPEGHRYADFVSINEAGAVAAPPELRGGEWFTIRIQVFPDGRCGVALNGQALSLGPPQSVGGVRARLALEGKSYRTRILVGRLELFTGVKRDIDWGPLLRSESSAVAGGGG